MVTKKTLLIEGYRNCKHLRIRFSLLSHIKHIRYGWWDCREAARDWWHYLRQDVAPDDMDSFVACIIVPFFNILGAPENLPDYPTPWGSPAADSEYFELLKAVLKGVKS